MNSTVRRFNFGESEFSMMEGNDKGWFKETDVARILGYSRDLTRHFDWAIHIQLLHT